MDSRNLVAVDLSRGEAADILPGIIRQIADRRVETILLVGLFDVDLYTVVWLHLGMHDLGVVVQCHKRVHHKNTSVDMIAKRGRKITRSAFQWQP